MSGNTTAMELEDLTELTIQNVTVKDWESTVHELEKLKQGIGKMMV